MVESKSLLDVLRSHTKVDCDTLDSSVAQRLGPFVDATANQAIALAELAKPEHHETIEQAHSLAQNLHTDFPDVAIKHLAVELSIVLLSISISRYVTGFVHFQVNPFNANDTYAIVQNALRIRGLYTAARKDFDVRRICIKIPSTWEGLVACKTLHDQGLTTLATTLFTNAQAVMADAVGCEYIAPYVHQLQGNDEQGFSIMRNSSKSPELPPSLPFCGVVQQYMKHSSTPTRTKVVPAALQSKEECMSLAGVDHITIPPHLLHELAATNIGDAPDIPIGTHMLTPNNLQPHNDDGSFERDQASFLRSFMMEQNGIGAAKQIQAINFFCRAQTKLEEMVAPFIQ